MQRKHNLPVMYHILYVDDDPALLEIGKQFLEDGGQFSVDICPSASDALDLLASANYDAIISDYQMPGMDGIGFLKKVRTSGNTIPFILFTGRGREEVVIQALNEGADFYLQKGGEPVSQFAELAHKIRQSVQKRQAEITIRNHERREADIINFLPDATFAIDLQGNVIAWNRAIEKMTGVETAKILGKGNYEYSLPFYGKRRPIIIDLVLNPDEITIGKYPFIRKEGDKLISEIFIPHFLDGRDAYLWFTASPLYDSQGTISGAIESIRDITNLKQVEVDLRESEIRYRHIVEDQTEFICRFLPDGTHIFVNEAYCRYFGINREKIIGSRFRPRIHPEDRENVARLIASLTTEQPLITIDQRIIMADGSTRWQRWVDRAIFHADGSLKEYQSVGRDITDWKQSEEALRRSEERYRTVFENTGNATMVIQENCIISFANNEFARLSGFSKDEIDGKMKWTEFVTDEDRERMLAQHRLRRESPEKALTRYEFRFVMRSGDIRTVSATIEIIPGTKMSIASLHDITGRKRAEEALKLESQRIVSLLSLSQMGMKGDSEVTAQVVEDAIRLTGSTIGYLATVNDDESVMTMQYWSRSAHESCKIVNKPIVYAVEKTGLWGEAVRQRSPVITNDYASENPLKRGTPNGHIPLMRHMNIPVFEGDHIVAIAGVGNKDTAYNEGDVHELQLLMQGWWQILVRKRAEDDIRRSNIILKTQQETSPDGILTVDECRKILNYNQTFVTLWGIPGDLLASGIHEPVLQHIAGQVVDPDTFLTRISSLYDHKEEKSSGDLLLKDGRILEWFSAPMVGEKEEYFGRVWFFQDITRRRMDEDAVRAAQEKFSTVYFQSPDIIWISELESGRFIDVNKAAEHIFGYTREEFLGRTSLDLGIWVNPDDRAVLVQEIRKEGRVDRSKIILRRKNGENFPAECSASTIHIRGTEYLIITIRDVSEIKQAEEALRASEERFRHLIETTSDWIWETDSTGAYTYVSPKIRDLLGYVPDEVIGKTPFDLMPPEESEKVASLFSGYITARKPFTGLENTNLHKDGRYIVLETSGVPFFDTKHTFLGYRGIDRDITERKQAEDVVRESECRFRDLFNSMSSGVAVLRAVDDGADFVFVDFNPGAEKIDKTKKQDVMGRPVSEIFPGVIEFGIMDVFRRVWRTGEPERHPLSRYKDERITGWRENYIYRLPSGEIVAIYDDVTERKQAEESVRKSFAILKGVVESPEDVVIFALDRQYRYTAFNENHRRTMKQIWGVDITVGNSMPDYIRLPEDRKKAVINFDRALTGESFSVIEVYGDTAFERRWYEDIYNPVTDENGNVIGLTLFLTDITERRRAEEALQKAYDELEIRVQERTAALRKSEEQLKLKLDSILLPDTDISDLELINILDIPAIQSLMDDFSQLTGMVTAIVDLKGNVIESSGWKDICKKFHRVNERSARFCTESDLYLAQNLKPGECVAYKCRNNVWDVVTPLFIGDKHIGNVYTGQFFYDDDIIEDAVFVAQAEEFGFDREKYIAALHSVPRFSHEQIHYTMDYLVKVSGFISRLSYSNLKLARAMTDQKRVQEELQTLYDELENRVIERTAELSQAQAAYKQANNKLNLLSGITRHDINNQLLIARGFLTRLHKEIPDPAYEKYFTRIGDAWSRISSMIQFTKHYEQIGVSAPLWQDCRILVDTAVKDISPGDVLVKNDLPANTEVFADPLIVKVFYNLVDNALRYGGPKMTMIRFSAEESADCGNIICEDDGVGVPAEEKERIFDRGFGKNTGMGLWLAREILSITNITITETGMPGTGARFEINVPKAACQCTDTK